MKKNILLVSCSFIFIGLIAWFFFIKTNPNRDAKKVLAAFCTCTESGNEDFIKINDNFLKNFNTYNFKNQAEAWSKLSALKKGALAKAAECQNTASNLYTELRVKYLSNVAELQEFDSICNGENNSCNPSNSSKLVDQAKEIEEKMNQLKSGQQIDVGGLPQTPDNTNEQDRVNH
jgi:hypothetical protein